MGEVCSKATLAQICNENETERYQIEHPLSPRIQDLDFSSIREGVFDKRKKELSKSKMYLSRYNYGEVTKDRDDGPLLKYNDMLILDYNDRIAQVEEENDGSQNTYMYHDPHNISSYQMSEREKTRLENLYENQETQAQALEQLNNLLHLNQPENEEIKRSEAEIQGEVVNRSGMDFADLMIQKANIEVKRNTDLDHLKNGKMFQPSQSVLNILSQLPQFEEHYYKTDERDNLNLSAPDVHIDKDLSYFGCLHNQRYQGNGILVKLDNFIYLGHFLNNVFSGYGRLILPNGTYYTGLFKDGNFHGKGNLVNNQDMYTYKGQFQDGKIQGFGIKIYPDGSRFEGSFLDYKEEGPGIKVLKDGTLINAHFLDGRVEKQGTIEYQNGDIYKGGLKDKPIIGDGGKEFFRIYREGTGLLEKENGEVYEGQFLNDKQEGQGKLSM